MIPATYIVATIALFVWLWFAHPIIAAVWLGLALIPTLFLLAAVRTIEEGEE